MHSILYRSKLDYTVQSQYDLRKKYSIDSLDRLSSFSLAVGKGQVG